MSVFKMVSTRGVKFKFCEGEKVLCYEPDPTKAKVLYESKVLESCVTKDNRKRKSVEYLVHFNGWSNSWDRFVPEDFILKDNDENRALQRRLTEAAAVHLNVKKKKRLPEIFKEIINRKKSEATVEDWKGSEATTNQSSESSTESSSEEEAKLINLEIPNALKKQLEADYTLIKMEQKLVKLPQEPNVIGILEGYVKTYATNTLCSTPDKKGRKRHMNAEKTINLCKEVMDGLRIYFDFSLPLVLLFNEEKVQHEYCLAQLKPHYVEPETKPSLAPATIEHIDVKQGQHFPTCSSSKETTTPSDSGISATKHGKSRQEPQLSPIHDLSPRSCRSAASRTPKREHSEEFSEFDCPKRILRSSVSHQDVEPKPDVPEPPVTEEEHRVVIIDSKEDKPKTSKGYPTRPVQLTVTRLRNRSGASPPLHPPTMSPVAAHGLDSRVQPLPPLQIPSHISSICSSPSRGSPPTPTLQACAGAVESTSALEQAMTWQMIPPKVYTQIPPPPSLLYGAQHLLRLFVKLPEMVKRTNIADHQLDMLLMHMELFLKYLENRQSDFFPVSAYEDASDKFKTKSAALTPEVAIEAEKVN